MGAEHTPGPWKWIPYNKELEDLECLESEAGEVVCHFGNNTHYYPTEGSPPNDADSALIAAAPELLAACEATLKSLEESCVEEDDDDPLIDLTKTVRAAIAKARGGQ